MQETWHHLSIEEVFRKMETTKEGLSTSEARRRLKLYGPNEIAPSKKRNIFFLFINQFKSPLIYILLIAALITYFLNHSVDTWVILSVVIFNACFGLLHELKAEKAMEALSKIIASRSKVKRDEILFDLPSNEIVPGDVVEITAGMKIAADLRIIEQQDLRIDESVLTGESLPGQKSENVLPVETVLGDRENMLYGGTVVVSGRGWGLTVETGIRTEFGKIAAEVGKLQETKTPLQNRLANFSQKYLIVVFSAVTLFFVVGVIKRLEIIQMFLTALSAAISAIPEGLPAVITVALATGAFKMAKRKAIIRKLIAVETLGSITTIASDKTGTLTHNQMTIEKIYIDEHSQIYQIIGSGYEPKGEIIPNPKNELLDFLKFGVLCSDAEIFQKNREWEVSGDPTEGALITAAGKAGITKAKLNEAYVRLDEIPFETKKGFMATLNRQGEKNLLVVKGAPEKILAMSTTNDEQKQRIIKIIDDFSKNALRVIGVAKREFPLVKKEISADDLKNLNFIGLAGMMDPPRKEAIEAIKTCRTSGIRPIMITGDYSLTAHAVAKDLRLIDGEDGVVSGEDLEKMSAEDFRETLKKFSVFARISPEMKLKIVEGLQSQGEIVAVTGDGINDAPALKKADIGVAMGEGGTDASREVADLVLADNNFATIIAAIEEGRTIFQNIRRVIFYLLSTSVGELFILFMALLLYLPPFNLPLLPVQILWLNLVTDGTAGLSLALEPSHEGVLKYPPRSPKESILNKIMIERIILVSLVMLIGTVFLYNLEIKSGADISRARTIAFTTMVVFQVLNVLNSRSLKESIFKIPFFANKYVLGSMLLSFVLSLTTIYVAPMRTLFHTTAITFIDLLKIILVASSIIVVVEIEKYIRRRTNARY